MRKPRLSTETIGVIAAARDLAHRGGHDAVREEHVLAVLAASHPVGSGVLTQRRLSARTLLSSVEMRLRDDLPSAGYRGALPRDDELEALLHRAASSRWFWRWFRTLEVIDLLDTLCASPRLRSLIEGARFDLGPVLAFAAGAKRAADERNHRNVLAEHALLAACETRLLRGPLEAGGIDVDAVCQAFARLLRNGRFVSGKLAPTEALVTIACVHANAARAADVSVGPLVVDLLRNAYVVRSLASRDYVAFDLLFAFVHGAPQDRGEDVATAAASVTAHNDSFTTMEHVVWILQDVFDHSEQDAIAAMIAVHQSGSVGIGSFELADSRARLERARILSRDAGMPLRLTLSPAP